MRKVKRSEAKALRPQPSPPGEECWLEQVGQARSAVWLQLRRQGRDWVLLVGGGETHVGAVAVAWPQGQSLVEVPGHKEGPLARESAARVCRASGATCTAVVGIHQDNATREEIRAIVAHVEQGLDRLIERCFVPPGG